MFKLTLVERHAILLPGAALINPAGVGVRAVVGHGHQVRRQMSGDTRVTLARRRVSIGGIMWTGVFG